jgi:hypothetical protein
MSGTTGVGAAGAGAATGAAISGGLALAAPAPDVMSGVLRHIKETAAANLGAGLYPKRVVAEANKDKPETVAAVVPASLKEMIGKKKRFLFGVSFVEVATQGVLQIAVARQTGYPQELIRDLVFSVFVGYTVSRDWATEYLNLHSSSVLRHFEIDGRVVDRSDPLFGKNAWVNTSRMNSTAAHLLAYLVVESAPAGGVLAKLKKDRGTPFTDANKDTTQGELITELAKNITAEDRDALGKFGREFAVLIKVVDLIFGDVGSDLNQALEKAAAFKPAEF